MAYRCKKCKHVIKNKKRYCPYCGSDLKKYKFRRICKCFIWGIVLLILCSAGFLFFQQKRAEYTVNEFLTAYRDADEELCGELLYSNIGEKRISFSETQKLLAQKMSWKIKKSCFGWRKNQQVDVQIENLDFEKIAENFKGKQVTEKEIRTAISEAEADKSYNCKVTVCQYDKKYKIIMTDTLSNALFAGLNKYLQKNMGN